MQCGAPTPHNPSRPPQAGDCTGKALARPPLRRHNKVIRGEGGNPSGTRRERQQPLGWAYDRRAADTLCNVGARREEVSLDYFGPENGWTYGRGLSAMLCDMPSA